MKIIKHLWRNEKPMFSRFDRDEFYRIDNIFRKLLFSKWYEYRREFEQNIRFI